MKSGTLDGVECSVALPTRTDLGESPVWDQRTQRLYFIDINGKELHIYEPGTGAHRTTTLSEPIGTIIPTADPNTLLAALSSTIVEVDVTSGATGAVVAAVPPEHQEPPPGGNMRFNDGKASPSGVVVLGRMHSKWRDGKPGRLYRMQARGTGQDTALPCELVEVLGSSEVTLPNGMAWAPGVMYFVDSGAGTVTAYDSDERGVPVREEAGAVKARVVTTIPKSEGVPDGMTIDSEGKLWVALADGGAVAQYDPSTGQQLRKVPLPVKRPTACTFGGPDLSTLYITTRVEAGEAASEHWGALLALRLPGVRGAAAAYPAGALAP